MTVLRWLLPLIVLLGALPAAAASSVQNPHTRITLISESAAPRPGKPLTVGLVMTPAKGWHTYWQNPGDAGIPTRAAWTLPAGAAAGALRYAVPHTFIVSGLMNYVYGEPNTLLAEIAVPAGLAPGSRFPLKVKVDWLVCDENQCVPESATLELPLAVGDGAPDPAQAGAFAAARAALPKTVAWAATYAVKNGRFVLAVPFPTTTKVRGAYFFPEAEGVLDYAAPQQLSIAGEAVRLETKAAGTPSAPVAGILRVERDGAAPLGFAITARPGAVPAAGAAPAARAESAGAGAGGAMAGFLPAFLLAVAGGLLLNVMPCVFPILSLKALSLAKGGMDERAARVQALAYTAGVVLICSALGGLILLLRAAGDQVGWAFQLQDPRVIVALLLLMTAIALNLAGLFEVSLPGGGGGQSLTAKPGAAGSFWTGALAAFVATPCTGPFMAGALGAALVLPPLAGLLVFAGLGLGLALPFLLLGYVPALRRRLPRPGAWMTRLRHVLSVPMFLTAVGLAWVLGRQAGVTGMTIGLLAALGLGLALWWLGVQQRAGGEKRRSWLPLGAGAAASLLAIAMVVESPPAAAAPTVNAPAGLAAKPFSPERLAALQAAGTPAFVYFTADWCITCKVNERGALASEAVARSFAANGVQVLVGDWTNGDAGIGKFLESRGRSGVPLYLWYGADGEVRELPQILTVDALTSLTA